jgi:hypothetical protein
METEAKDVQRKGAWRDAKGSPSVTYTPRPDATPEGELTALANAYRYLLFHRHETSEDVEADSAEEQRGEHAK